MYITVLRDLRDITVTTPTSAVEALCQELAYNGVSVLDTGLSGRYHTSVHKDIPEVILDACSDPQFGEQQLVRSNHDGKILSKGTALLVLQDILCNQGNWYSTITLATSALPGEPTIISIGTDAMPHSIVKSLPQAKIITRKVHTVTNSIDRGGQYPDSAIAVIGMACKFPGADTIDEFWDLLTKGKSMLERMPKDRFSRDELPRSNEDLQFWGNFVKDIDAFDHKFFKKSPREAASMDPQQRLLLQVAYQTLESSGYFVKSRGKDIGCYLGTCSTDYDHNVGSHPPTAYSTTGTLRAFLSGKISHHFGWSGPSLTFDTACSSSAVAIHTACTALRMEECSQAVAGGVTLLTSPYLYENLATAHFLSPTGATKPFDAAADGYCRGEGVGLVMLKKLTNALADGDAILGVIAASAINQNNNCVPITVPHSPSQGMLYRQVADQAGIRPHDVTFVEAHGTGTPVGDPIEMESIRDVFGGQRRSSPLFVSSVKGNIGHLEGASGVAAVIKALLQMQHRTATVQASFSTMNPKIPMLEPDKLAIPRSNQPLAGALTACVNNYGAAGSNAAMMLVQGPSKPKHTQHGSKASGPPKYPIQLNAATLTSLLAYCSAFDRFCGKSTEHLLADIAFSAARMQNQELSHMLTLSATSIGDLQTQLRQQTSKSNTIKQRPKEPSVILCFGGQVSECVGLDKTLWQRNALLRHHLDVCDGILVSMGHPSLYPDIFRTDSVANVVTLQSMVFAVQYASAQAWLDSGLKVSALVGHSLGQLTAICVSGMLSLRDGLKLVAGRASLMQKHWGPEPGTMIAVEADQQTVEDVISIAGRPVEIACYNGPTSHVVVSDKASADTLESELIRRKTRHKRLNVTYGFHSRFTDPLLPHLEELASSLEFHEAHIPLETCSDVTSWEGPTAQLIAGHTREPVFFGQAIQRLHSKFGGCTWLEAGSDSSIVGMVRRAISNSKDDNFIPVQLDKANSQDLLVGATIDLWNCGHQVQFWDFHRMQAACYDVLRLPPYEFEKPKHWLNLVTAPPKEIVYTSPSQTSIPPSPPELVNFVGKNDAVQHFTIDPTSAEYQALVKGHEFAGEAVCPATLFIEVVARAIRIIGNNLTDVLSLQDLHLGVSIGVDLDRKISLDLTEHAQHWTFQITSTSMSSRDEKPQYHASGAVHLSGNNVEDEFLRYKRLTGYKNIATVMDDPQSESIQGSMVYRFLSSSMVYADHYRGVKAMAALNDQVVGKVVSPKKLLDVKKPTIQPCVVESFLQIVSLFANCIYECVKDKLFWPSKIERIQFGQEYQAYCEGDHEDGTWNVHAFMSTLDNGLASDIFVYDARTERIVMFVLGVHFESTDSKSLVRAPDSPSMVQSQINTRIAPENSHPQITPTAPAASTSNVKRDIPGQTARDAKASIYEDIYELLDKLAEVPRHEVKNNASFDDVGVDSLMMIEVINELSMMYHVELPIDDLEKLTDFDSLVQYLHSRGCIGKTSKDVNYSSDDTTPSSSISTSPGILESSPITTQSPTPVLTPSSPSSDKGITAKLAGLLAEHLELETEIRPTDKLADLGLDSLLCMELQSDARKRFAVDIDIEKLDYDSTFADLLDVVIIDGPSETMMASLPDTITTSSQKSDDRPSSTVNPSPVPKSTEIPVQSLQDPQLVFEDVRYDFDKHAEQTRFKDFWKKVYSRQADLVTAYVVEAFRKLGCDMTTFSSKQILPLINALPKHKHLVKQLWRILIDSEIVEQYEDRYLRTSKPINPTPAAAVYEKMLQDFPDHVSETKLLNVSASRLSDCMTGKQDPLALLFANKANRDIMADVYDNAPMCQATTRLLADFLVRAMAGPNRVFQILEVGAGTGGTARYLVDYLDSHGLKFEYTFTDISNGLVSAAKKKFSEKGSMKFMTLDCNNDAKPELRNKFDFVIATNVIHATTNATTSAANIAPFLRDDGVFCLVEFTIGLYWFDLVYGLLEGWWLFDDGRQHALADECFWDQSLRAAGYKHVSWTDGPSKESQTMRLICAFKNESKKQTKKAAIPMETFIWKRVGNTDLKADVYYPKKPDEASKRRPLGMSL